MKYINILLILLITYTSTFSNHLAEEGTIIITIKNIENQGGIMMVAIFKEDDKFLETPSFSQEIPLSTETEIEVIFENIPYRKYAVSIFHDLNENGDLDSNMIRIPKEPVGFSNDYFPKFGPPKFKNAAFDLDQKEMRMIVNLKSY